MKTALVTGITGQDGSYLTELLLDKGYTVHGVKRRSSSINTERIDHLYGHQNLKLHYGDLTDSLSMVKLVGDIRPDEIYNLGAQSHVQVSFETPENTANSDALGALRLLEAIRINRLERRTKFYQAATSELYGLVQEVPQTETTPFYPRSPYGVAKLYSYWITKNYREAYDMFACNGILFNHESPRRGETFVTRKIVLGLKGIKDGKQDVLRLGNLNALRDWGHAKDYVKAMWMMMQQEKPQDYVIATGQEYTVKQFVEKCAPYFDMDIKWTGVGKGEQGYDTKTGKTVVVVDEKYLRPAEVDRLLGDATKAQKELGWHPEYSFDDLVEDMCLNGI
jgi:GDPmannose 4,6-dehydratase